MISEENRASVYNTLKQTGIVSNTDIKNKKQTEEKVQDRSHPSAILLVDYRHTFRTLNVIVSEGFRYTHTKKKKFLKR